MIDFRQNKFILWLYHHCRLCKVCVLIFRTASRKHNCIVFCRCVYSMPTRYPIEVLLIALKGKTDVPTIMVNMYEGGRYFIAFYIISEKSFPLLSRMTSRQHLMRPYVFRTSTSLALSTHRKSWDRQDTQDMHKVLCFQGESQLLDTERKSLGERFKGHRQQSGKAVGP